MDNQTKGVLITCLGVLTVIPDSTMIRLIDADIYTIIVWRSFISAGFILLGMILYYRSQFITIIKSFDYHSLIFGITLAFTGPFFALAVEMTSIANTVFIIATMPVFSALSSWLLINEVPSKRMIYTICFALFGILIIAYGSSNNGSALTGDIMALLCAALFGFALTIARKAKARSMIPIIPFSYFFGALFFLPFATPLNITGSNLIYVPMHNIFIAISTCLLAIGPRYITSAEVALLILGESILAPILAWAVLNEFPGKWTLIGGAIVLNTLIISNIIALRKRRN